MSSENNLRNKQEVLRKMYESGKLLKCVLGNNKKSSYSHFFLSQPPKILQVLIFLIFLSVLELVP